MINPEQATPTEQPSSLVSNSPMSTQLDELRSKAEADLKAELLKELSLDDVRNLVAMARSGAVFSQDAPDTFDEYGRNFSRMVRKVEVMGSSGSYWTERPMARTLKEAQTERKDWFDPTNKVWIRSGYKREQDYPENTTAFWEEKSNLIGAKS